MDQGDGNGNPDMTGNFDPAVAERLDSEHNALAAAARVGSAPVPAPLAAGEWELKDPFPDASVVFPYNTPDPEEEADSDDMDTTTSTERLHPALERLIARLNDDLDALTIG